MRNSKKLFCFLLFLFCRQNLFCDVTLIAENMEIPAHKMVLASCSAYFYAMFSSFDFEESRQDKITVQGVDFHALQLLVEYVYTSYVEVTENNVQVNCVANISKKITDLISVQ